MQCASATGGTKRHTSSHRRPYTHESARMQREGARFERKRMAKSSAVKRTTKKPAKKAPLKTSRNKGSVAAFIAAVADEKKRADAKAIDKMLREVTGEKPALWGPSIVGYGAYTYTNTMGEATWPKIGFSPRKGATVLYILPGLLETDPLMKKLGKYKNGKSCLYINKLSDVDPKVLRELATRSWQKMSERHG